MPPEGARLSQLEHGVAGRSSWADDVRRSDQIVAVELVGVLARGLGEGEQVARQEPNACVNIWVQQRCNGGLSLRDENMEEEEEEEEVQGCTVSCSIDAYEFR